MSDTRHLWECDHPYYCNRGNYFTSDDNAKTEYESFEDFVDGEGKLPICLNLVFRWDWEEGGDYDLPEFDGDSSVRNGRLILFIIGQRKGHYRWVEINVCRDDEPKVVEYLRPRLRHLLELWEPLSPQEPTNDPR